MTPSGNGFEPLKSMMVSWCRRIENTVGLEGGFINKELLLFAVRVSLFEWVKHYKSKLIGGLRGTD
jgi:hypothetical protein